MACADIVCADTASPPDVRVCVTCGRIYEPCIDAWMPATDICISCKLHLIDLRLGRYEIRVEGCPACQLSETEKGWLKYQVEKGIIKPD